MTASMRWAGEMAEQARRRRILLVDDKESVRELVALSLGEDAYDLRDAPDGQTALLLARSFRPDLVLLDVVMPEMDGFSVCRMLKSDPETSHITIVMLTGLVSDTDRAEAVAAGADHYITKPFSPTALVATVHALLRR